ncbi:MAG: hypothetical protein R3181_02520 [Rubricoccaceae bacterium]|nr:hypothetical protein [Rubricoccaceae bacterium]
MTDPAPGAHLPTPDDRATADRFARSVSLVKAALPPPAHLLDLGISNPLADLMRHEGYAVSNTDGDLDLMPETVREVEADAVTAFEVLEHLVAPYNVLRAIKAPRLFASVPLRLWFARAYRNEADPWDRHFHEFEDWQFDWLLRKSGWRIVQREYWVPRPGGVPLGIRPILRRFTPRWYAVEAIRESR